ncbi:MAG: hypothetical protein ACI9DC_005208, partial [Gammaproteobacteria bacterium]
PCGASEKHDSRQRPTSDRLGTKSVIGMHRNTQ